MQFRILGPIEVHDDSGAAVPSLPPKASRILAVLALDCGKVVPVDRLIDLVWGEEPPPQARKSLQVHISTLRRAGVPVEHRTAGYRLDADPDHVDAHVFRSLTARAGEIADPAERRVVLGEALALWRGAPVTGIERLAGPLEAQRLAAVEEAADADLALGRHAEVVDLLADLVEEHPLAERLRVRLMRALAGAGRRTEAMRVFHDTRRLLVDELGVEPGPQLQQLYRAVLDGAEPEPVRRNYLPRDVGDFTGRAEELARLTEGEPHGVWWIEGAAGVGKSAFAVHAAHRLAARYPDGQLFVDLHALPPVPGAALDVLLRALDVPTVRIPTQLDERAALWRAQLTGRRVLIVLDGVAGVSQVRQLLPGAPGCLTLVTSRNRPVDRQVQRLALDVLTPQEAVALLTGILGDDRVAEDPEAALEVARLCGHLPLAVRITGARLAGRPHWPVSRLVSRLRDERGRLDELVADDLAVRSSLELTLRALDGPARRAYRAFGFLDHPELPAGLAPALLGLPEDAAEDVLDRLVDARLLDVTGRHRYRMHDLVRIHARELAEAEDDVTDRFAAFHRVLVECQAKVDGCVERLMPVVPRMQDFLGELHDHPVPRAERDAWFAVEEPLLIKVVERAAELGFAAQACDLAEALVFAWFGLRNRYDGWERTHRAALDAVVAVGDRRREAVLRCSLGQLYFKRDEFAEAGRWFADAGALFVRLGDRRGEAVALNGAGMVAREQARYGPALASLHRARTLLAELGDAEGAAHSLYGIGSVQRELGRDAQALQTLRAAEEVYRSVGSARGEALAVRGIGLVHRARDEHLEAEDHFRRAHDIVLALEDPLMGCYTAQSLAKVWLRTGRFAEAALLLVSALENCRELGDRFGLALLRRTLGELHLAAGELDLAEVLLGAALTTWDDLELPAWRARTLRDLGAVHAGRGDDDSAARCWSEAALLFAELGSREAGEPISRTRSDCSVSP
ncbi:AfsR/SARP family transcriptional regulator [Umezawaea tangerina]|uniref:DNA-binding SARP family transcriptional activator n=1 Tax=Umezawaea tangerina TaxID=84725 RepID=A0A2T0SQX2_9PSEU|nr:AfsR/SARP family transcriptional regulator [Umezawaea tangerina]PRY35807.1 DNA-binding SARP family transcriptional activator [Umezawaea tangerina]